MQDNGDTERSADEVGTESKENFFFSIFRTLPDWSRGSVAETKEYTGIGKIGAEDRSACCRL